ncbi:isoniazid response ATPase/transcriptional regulator IniR [Mycolicibacterium sp. 3033]|nr:isoniazid response ATPase/transcriptional regulator IniR [Mycolicibacterium aurantiacum]
MTGPGPRPTDVPPAAREAVGLVERDPHAATKLLVTGGIGTGKSTVLAALRQLLRGAGRAVLSRPPRPGDTDGAAVLIDDADLLELDDIDEVAALVEDSAATVVIGAQPLAHHAALRRLFLALERENPPVALGPLSPVDVGRITAAALGEPAAGETVRTLVAATAGLPFLLRPAIGSIREGNPAVRRAAQFALIERLRRLDEPLLDTLLISSLATGLGTDDVAAGLRMTSDDARAAVDRARASGLLDPSLPPGFPRDVHDAVASIVGAAHHHDIEVSVLTSQVATATLTAELALRLAEHGLRDERLAAALTELAGQDTAAPARAARLYRAAARAGDSVPGVHLADALALTGDCATAARLADDMLTASDTADRAAAVRIAASIALHDGNSAQARDLFAWLAADSDPFEDPAVGAAATISAMAAGDAAAARAGTDAPRSGPPTSAARAARAVTDGLVLTLDAPYPVALTRLSEAIGPDANPSIVSPDTPAALVALAALHGGDPVRARSVIGRAARHGSGRADQDGDDGSDAIFVTYRHRLLHGWTLMQDGQLQAATAAAAAVTGQQVHRRDALWATALQTAIARRSGDTGAMQQHWYAAMEVLAECAPDLFALLPIGELWTAAARMRQVDRLRHVVDQAFEVLAGLGNPVLWSVPLHWAGVHAGILANSPDDVAPHGQALTAAAPHSAMAKVLATAGRTWLRVLADAVDTDEVAAAARGLAHVGHTSDATRLAGQAALHTTDPRISQAMLQLARDLKQAVATPEAPVESVDPRPAGPPTRSRPAASLSDREREVADLLLQGLPYRDIGAQLFISAKTVEHHVARIRRRLGAESRSEMLSMLRVMLAPAT